MIKRRMVALVLVFCLVIPFVSVASSSYNSVETELEIQLKDVREQLNA